jgi:SAM-dependent methyltransferase
MHRLRPKLPNFFSSGSPYLGHPLLTAERSRREIDHVLAETAAVPNQKILDAGCGFGRHALVLAEAGYDVTAIDPSEVMLDAASMAAQTADLSIEFLQCRAGDLTDKDCFEGAICLFTTFGQVGPDGEDGGLLAALHRALKPGSWLALEVPQREAYLGQMAAQDRFESPERTTRITRSFDAEQGIVSERFSISAQNDRREFLLEYRLFSAIEIRQALEQSGFTNLRDFGGYQAGERQDSDPFMLWLAEKGR